MRLGVAVLLAMLAALFCFPGPLPAAKDVDLGFAAPGDLLPLAPAQPLVVEKLLFDDCRAVRGFVIAPIDGRLDSRHYSGYLWEYPKRIWDGVSYEYNDGDGLHLRLANGCRFNYLRIVGGYRGKLYADATRLDGPGAGRLVCAVAGEGKFFRKLLPAPVDALRLSFFEKEQGLLADVSLYLVPGREKRYVGAREYAPAQRAEPPAALRAELERQFAEGDRELFVCAEGGANKPAALALAPNTFVHLLTAPAAEELSVGAVELALDLSGLSAPAPLTVRVHDPLNARRELCAVEVLAQGNGLARLCLDFPDQIVPRGGVWWLSLACAKQVALGPATRLRLLLLPRERALGEALAFRKLMLKGFFYELSEPRPWTSLRRNTDLDRWIAQSEYSDKLRELFDTLEQCRWLAPQDDMVREYYEWINRSRLSLGEWPVRVPEVPGAPRWAVLAHEAYLAVRAVPLWWLSNRLVPSGEFGGRVGDDTDMFQNYADFPLLEDRGLGAALRQAAARLSDLAEKTHLENGLNKHTTDPLHAYEEGINHQAMMPIWFYGDPFHLERAMTAARSLEALMVTTPRGHLHFKSQRCGAEDLRINRKTDRDGGAHPLMLHPAFTVAWYNRNPRALRTVLRWADSWLEHFAPGKYPTAVDVATEKVVQWGKRPGDGGYGSQASAFLYAFWITDDDRYIKPFLYAFDEGDYWANAERATVDILARRELERYRQALAQKLRGRGYLSYLLTGDKRELESALEDVIREFTRFRRMYTSAEPFTDRVFLYHHNVDLCYLGGYARRNKFCPTHALSWEGFSTDYAALVEVNRRDHLQFAVFNFAREPRRGAFRVWQLKHGRYLLRVGPDENDDGQFDSVTREETLELARYSRVPLTLPPRRLTLVELTLREELDEITARPDLALSPREVRYDAARGSLRVVVHNIGAKPAPASTLAVRDAAGNTLAKAKIPPLDAPLDLLPRKTELTIEGLAAAGPLTVVADPEGALPEICEENNVVTVAVE